MNLLKPIPCVLFLLLSLLNIISATVLNGRCGRLEHPEFKDSGNHRLRYRRNGEAVIATAIECPDYKRHLNQEALELKRQIQALQQKYSQKIKKIVDLEAGKHVSKKHMASSFSCDARTGDWKLNRQAVFSCQLETNPDGYDRLNLDSDSIQSDSDSLFQASEDTKTNEISRHRDQASPINANTFETETTRIYTENLELIDQFLTL